MELCRPNIAFGVREHAMGAIVNGMAAHGGVLPFSATFFTFSDYMKPAIRLGALSQLKVIYVFTHDSIGSARMARLTSQSSISPACAAFPDLLSSALPTRTRPPRHGPLPFSMTARRC